MTSDQIAGVIEQADKVWRDEGPLLAINKTTDVAMYRAMMEVAYQVALLNEGFESLTSQRGNQQLRVQVEPGDYPIAVTQL